MPQRAGKPDLAFVGLCSLTTVFGFVVPLVLAAVFTIDVGAMGPRRVGDLLDRFARQGYDLRAVMTGRIPAPRLFLTRLPKDWRGLTRADRRKRVFIMVMLPLVLQANERIIEDRDRLFRLVARASKGRKPGPRDRAWLASLASSYGLESADMKELARRVDIVPPSLAIAQAAMESGWGTSRFAIEGNALFGQWTEQSRRAMVPTERKPGRTHAIRRFEILARSVASYMRNLNVHRAYRKYRALRAELRRTDQAIDGVTLAGRLEAYSERGPDYVRTLRAIIAKNDLSRLDRVPLEP